MGDLHRLLGYGAAAAIAIAALLSIALSVTRRPPGRVFLVDVVVAGVIVIVTAAVGLLLLATGSAPADPLHLLYGGLVIVAIPLGYGIAGSRPERQQAVIALVASAVLLLLVVRLFQTGGS